MGERNVEIVRAMYDAFYAGDAERALSYFADDVVIDATVRVDGGIGHGREQLARIIGQWVASFDGWREEIEEMRADGDRVIVVATQRGRSREAGVEIEQRYSTLYELRAGAIVAVTLYHGRGAERPASPE